jgi:hypothetical protein
MEACPFLHHMAHTAAPTMTEHRPAAYHWVGTTLLTMGCITNHRCGLRCNPSQGVPTPGPTARGIIL